MPQTLPATDDDDDLDFARDLHRWGRPIFRVPQVGYQDQWRPWGHYTVADNAANITGRKPTDALAVAMGGRLCGFDVDPNRGCSIERAERIVAELDVKIIAEVVSGSGVGVHWYALRGPQPLPSRKDHAQLGLEFKDEGTCLFIPGGAGRDKHWGQRYRVAWSVLGLVEQTQNVDDSALRAWLGPSRTQAPSEAPRRPQHAGRGTRVDLTRTLIRDPRAYGLQAVANSERDIMTASRGSRNQMIGKTAFSLAGLLVALGWSQAELADAEFRLIGAARQVGHRYNEVRGSWQDGLREPHLPSEVMLP